MSMMTPLACQLIASTLSTLERLQLIYYNNRWDHSPQPPGQSELASLVEQVPLVSFVLVVKSIIQWTTIHNDLNQIATLSESIQGGGHLARLRNVYVVLRLSLDPEESRISWYNVEYSHTAGFRLTITLPSINSQRPLELEANLEMAKRRIDVYLVNRKTKRLAVRSVAAPDLCAMPLL